VTEFVFMIPSSSLDLSEEHLLNTLFNLQQPQGPPPASSEIIQSLKCVSVTEKLMSEQPSCSICYDDFELDKEVTVLPCNHAFDKDCIVTWLKLHNTCPVCRHSVKDETQLEKAVQEVSETDAVINPENQNADVVPPENHEEENKQIQAQPQPLAQQQQQDKNSNATLQEFSDNPTGSIPVQVESERKIQ